MVTAQPAERRSARRRGTPYARSGVLAVGSAVAVMVFAGAAFAGPASAAPGVETLAVVSEQGLLASSGDLIEPTDTAGQVLAVDAASPVDVVPTTPVSGVTDEATGASVYDGPTYGTVTGVGSDGANASFIVIKDAAAPTTYEFTIGEEGNTLAAADGGRVQVLDSEGAVINYLQAPWARDANGKDLPTRYTFKAGTNVITQTVDTTGAEFPVTADPSMGCGVGWCSVYFSRAETRAIAAGGGTAVGSITAACALIGGRIAGGACAALSGLIVSVAQGANANNRCLGIIGYGIPPALSGWAPFTLPRGDAHCK